jgi:hypothetical protein
MPPESEQSVERRGFIRKGLTGRYRNFSSIRHADKVLDIYAIFGNHPVDLLIYTLSVAYELGAA